MSLPLSFTDDEVALEAVELFNLTLSSPSDSRVQLGGSVGITDFPGQTEIAIADDDCELASSEEDVVPFCVRGDLPMHHFVYSDDCVSVAYALYMRVFYA